jgi:hypothetical protein
VTDHARILTRVFFGKASSEENDGLDLSTISHYFTVFHLKKYFLTLDRFLKNTKKRGNPGPEAPDPLAEGRRVGAEWTGRRPP